jgi:hypothetical protein
LEQGVRRATLLFAKRFLGLLVGCRLGLQPFGRGPDRFFPATEGLFTLSVRLFDGLAGPFFVLQGGSRPIELLVDFPSPRFQGRPILFQFLLPLAQPKPRIAKSGIDFRHAGVELRLATIQFLLPGAKMIGQLQGLRSKLLSHLRSPGRLAGRQVVTPAMAGKKVFRRPRLAEPALWHGHLVCTGDCMGGVNPHVA